MKLIHCLVILAVLAFMVGCSDNPVDSGALDEGVNQSPSGNRPKSAGTAASSLGGSSADAVNLKPLTCGEGFSQGVTITYTITGRQDNLASFKVNTQWSYNGSAWSGATPETVTVPARTAANPATIRTVDITVTNNSGADAGTSSFPIEPFDLNTSSPAALNMSGGNATIHVAFNACPVTNTAPWLNVPGDYDVEATSAAGAVVNFAALVTAGDAEDGDLTGSVVCTPVSGSTFSLGGTTVNCSVEDSGGLTAEGSFDITVVDTTPPALTCDAPAPTFLLNQAGAEVSGTADDLVSGTWAVSGPAPTNSVGSHTAALTATDAAGNPAVKDCPYSVIYAWTGFFRPVDNLPVLNSVKAGQAIPVKFSLGGNQGLNIFAAGFPKSAPCACDAGAPVEGIEETVTAGSSSLSYDASADQYNYVWKTDKGWANTCRQLTVKLIDGTEHVAKFKFTK